MLNNKTKLVMKIRRMKYRKNTKKKHLVFTGYWSF